MIAGYIITIKARGYVCHLFSDDDDVAELRKLIKWRLHPRASVTVKSVEWVDDLYDRLVDDRLTANIEVLDAIAETANWSDKLLYNNEETCNDDLIDLGC